MLDERRIRELVAEAQKDLQRYDALRENTLELLSSYNKRLKLIGAADVELELPGVGKAVMPNPSEAPKTNTAIMLEVLAASPDPLTAKETWLRAAARGAKSNSATPERSADSVIRELVAKGKVIRAAPGLFTVLN